MEEYPQQISKYNEAVNQLLRLNNLWSLCNDYSRSGKLMDWRWTLEAVWRELSSSIKKLDGLKKKYDDNKSWLDKKKDLIKEMAKSKNRNGLYVNLNNFEEFLRALQDAAGKGSKWIDPDEGGFD